jgi:hypothetical protein
MGSLDPRGNFINDGYHACLMTRSKFDLKFRKLIFYSLFSKDEVRESKSQSLGLYVFQHRLHLGIASPCEAWKNSRPSSFIG